MVSKIRKRDGRLEKFSYKKLYSSILKSIEMSERQQNIKLAKQLANNAVKTLNSKFKKKIPTVAEIKKIAADILNKKKLKHIRKVYLTFRYH